MDDTFENNIKLVCSQTNYTSEEVIEKLKNNSPIEIIRKYMNLSEKKDESICKTASQERFRLIRNVIYKNSHLKQV